MKRIAIMMLALLLVCPAAAAADWPEGLGPGQPYQGSPEVNLAEKLGYMVFAPDAGIPASNACQQLQVYLPREDVQPGEGVFTLYTAAGEEVWRAAMNDPEAVTRRDLREDELTGLMWGGGTCFEIRLPRTLELGETYFVNLTRGCIVTDGGVDNAQIGGTDAWRFTLEGDFGVSGMAYRRAGQDVLTPESGDEIRFDLTLGGEAVIASIYQSGDTADFPLTTFTESGTVTGAVTAENPVWGVLFLDAQGGVVRKIEFH